MRDNKSASPNHIMVTPDWLRALRLSLNDIELNHLTPIRLHHEFLIIP